MKWFSKLRASRQEMEKDDLRQLMAGIDITPIDQAEVRSRVTIGGTVQALTFQPEDATGLSVRIGDGTGYITLYFLGRREIPGLELGRRMVATGVVAEKDGMKLIHNPSYELLPGAAE